MSEETSNNMVVSGCANRYCQHEITRYRIHGANIDLYVLGYKTIPADLLTCIRAEDLDQFMAFDCLMQFFGAMVKHDEPYLPLDMELCVAMTSSRTWIRAIFLGKSRLDNGKGWVYSFDYGVNCKVNLHDIRVSIKSNNIKMDDMDFATNDLIQLLRKLKKNCCILKLLLFVG